MHMHFCEYEGEVKDIKNKFSVTHPSDLLNIFKGYKMILAHAVVLDDYDIKTMSKLSCSVSHNPISNLRLGCGFCDIVKLKKNGITVALGTDGDGSGSNQSILKSARLACLLPKATYLDATLVPAYEALQMATINGAKVLGLEKNKGSIEVGKDADVVIFDLSPTLTTPKNDVISDIVYNAEACNVRDVIVNGKIVIKNHKHQLVNVELLKKRIQSMCEAVKKRARK